MTEFEVKIEDFYQFTQLLARLKEEMKSVENNAKISDEDIEKTCKEIIKRYTTLMKRSLK
ncbi:putative secreted protein [Elusimicrobium simillimum]|uniref:hypothetical protein n=1 Tax=Elusimicrobium simillimum TaxID=3143438 RepID=UPI003C6F1F35